MDPPRVSWVQREAIYINTSPCPRADLYLITKEPWWEDEEREDYFFYFRSSLTSLFPWISDSVVVPAFMAFHNLICAETTAIFSSIRPQLSSILPFYFFPRTEEIQNGLALDTERTNALHFSCSSQKHMKDNNRDDTLFLPHLRLSETHHLLSERFTDHFGFSDGN